MKRTGNRVEQAGCALQGVLIASPDGVVREGEQIGLLEVKTIGAGKRRLLGALKRAQNRLKANAIAGRPLIATADTRVKSDDDVRAERALCQVYGALALAGLGWSDFVLWSKDELYIERVSLDDDVWRAMRTSLLRFYVQHYLPLCQSQTHLQLQLQDS